MPFSLTAAAVKQIALDCGFELAGIAATAPVPDFERYRLWARSGMAGEMKYLTDHRGDMRADPRNLLPSAKSILCVGKLYNSPYPYSTRFNDDTRAWISRYAWGSDYHNVLRSGLGEVTERLKRASPEPFESRICVDTAPILERSLGRLAGLGWIGRNTCLINQQLGSWFFLGELLLSLDLAADSPPPDRCGTCRRCIDACPTAAFVEQEDGAWSLDARLCISYLTIEKRGPIEAEQQKGIGHHLFGCDICQDVCPWNRREHFSSEQAFAPQAAEHRTFAPSLSEMAALGENEFRSMFRNTPVWRAKYTGFLRNVAIALGNSGNPDLLGALDNLSRHVDPVVSETARQARARLRETIRACEYSAG